MKSNHIVFEVDRDYLCHNPNNDHRIIVNWRGPMDYGTSIVFHRKSGAQFEVPNSYLHEIEAEQKEEKTP